MAEKRPSILSKASKHKHVPEPVLVIHGGAGIFDKSKYGKALSTLGVLKEVKVYTRAAREI